MVKIEIDKKEVEMPPGLMIIEAIDKLRIPIPRFCYHKKLSIAANCRMCLVEVEKAPKPMPACATPIMNGMKIWTKTSSVKDFQQSVMEFLLINHPLDCPVCDQGGECELQDVAMLYGKKFSCYKEKKRVVNIKDFGFLISTHMQRCIHCTRCVRFSEEICGRTEIGMIGRGENSRISSFVEGNISSDLSGNIIDLCPVGALTSKPFKYLARSWELTQNSSISPHDCIGSNIYIHTKENKIMRVVPKENECINEIWISDRDRFSYLGIYNKNRLETPLLKCGDKWVPISWEAALEYVNNKFKEVIKKYGSKEVGGLISHSATLEEQYLFQRYFREMGSQNIDHRLNQIDFYDQKMFPLYPNLGVSISEIESQKSILIIGSDINKDHPIIGIKLRKMCKNGGIVSIINPIDFDFTFDVAVKMIGADDVILNLIGIAKAIIEKKELFEFNNLFKEFYVSESNLNVANYFLVNSKKLILLGRLALNHPQSSKIISLCNFISSIVDVKIGMLTEGSNTAGAWLTGCIPHRSFGGGSIEEPGYNAFEMLQNSLKGYMLFGIDPAFDSVLGAQAYKTLKNANFVVGLTSFKSKFLLDVCSILLPTSTFGETSGTFVNVAGTWQKFSAAVSPFGESRSGWKILRMLGVLAKLEMFSYNDIEEVLDEVKLVPLKKECSISWDWSYLKKIDKVRSESFIWLGNVSSYLTDSLLRSSEPLKQTKEVENPIVRLSVNSANKFKLVDNDIAIITGIGFSVKLPIVVDNRISDRAIFISQGFDETTILGIPYNKINIKKATKC